MIKQPSNPLSCSVKEIETLDLSLFVSTPKVNMIDSGQIPILPIMNADPSKFGWNL